MCPQVCLLLCNPSPDFPLCQGQSSAVPTGWQCCPCRVALRAGDAAPPGRCSGAPWQGPGRLGQACRQRVPPAPTLALPVRQVGLAACHHLHRHFWEGRMREGWVSAQRLGTCLQLQWPWGPAPQDHLGEAPSTGDPVKPQGWSVAKERGLQPRHPAPPCAHRLSCCAQGTPEAHPRTPSLPVP